MGHCFNTTCTFRCHYAHFPDPYLEKMSISQMLILKKWTQRAICSSTNTPKCPLGPLACKAYLQKIGRLGPKGRAYFMPLACKASSCILQIAYLQKMHQSRFLICKKWGHTWPHYLQRLPARPLRPFLQIPYLQKMDLF